MGNIDQAIEYLRRATRLDPKDEYGRKRLEELEAKINLTKITEN
jgi:Tfp pilus assembly protein PilF